MKNRRSLKDPLVYSHILFFLNGLLYMQRQFFLLSSCLFCCTVASFFYHLSKEKSIFWGRIDRKMCFISVGVIVYHLIQFADWKHVILCILWLCLSLFVYKISFLSYKLLHSLWHVGVYIGNLFVLLSIS